VKAFTVQLFDAPGLRQRAFAWSKLTAACQRRKERRYTATHVPRGVTLGQVVTRALFCRRRAARRRPVLRTGRSGFAGFCAYGFPCFRTSAFL
jgi:hypothetical protein